MHLLAVGYFGGILPERQPFRTEFSDCGEGRPRASVNGDLIASARAPDRQVFKISERLDHLLN
jgi:hypothetical protein